ncbi:unnamed protein product, partial [Phaeothamnion confervicola]
VVAAEDGLSELTKHLAEALRLQWVYGFPHTPRGFDKLTHGMHYYPASLQASSARLLLDSVLPGGSVFDPFVGGGTVLIEGMRLGRATIGTDLSPLALFVAAGRTWLADESSLFTLEQVAAAVVSDVTEKKQEGQPTAAAWASIHAAIAARLANGGPECTARGAAQALWFCASAAQESAARLRHMQPIDPALHLLKVVTGYCAKLRRLRKEVPLEVPPPRLTHADSRGAREASAAAAAGDIHADSVGAALTVDAGAPDLVGAVLTSPPYPAVYNYLSQARQARAMLPPKSAGSAGCFAPAGATFLTTPVPSGRDWPAEWEARAEVGAYQAFKRDPKAFRNVWQRDQEAWLAATRRRLQPGGRACVIVGDGGGVDALTGMQTAAEGAGLRFLASATLMMKESRTEHCLLFENG